MKVGELLKQKGSQVLSAQESETIYEALEVMVKQKVGALLVFNESKKVTGIISERDIVRECYKGEKDFKKARVKDAMSKGLVIATPEDDLDYVMGIMTNNRVRHIPIISGGILHGIISIGDVVKAQLHDARYENKYLKEYMFGGQSPIEGQH